MLKLFIIIYHTTQVGGVIGPLPYDIVECEKRIAPMEASRLKALDTRLSHDGKPIPAKNMAIIENMRFACEYRDKKPEVDLK